MRRPRIKSPGEGFYHVVSRISGRRFLMGKRGQTPNQAPPQTAPPFLLSPPAFLPLSLRHPARTLVSPFVFKVNHTPAAIKHQYFL